ncbi:MAG: hypothetical protein E7052_10415 [Lentisphaerae bacterium]|nr:hypothetical protein [Lentisphaerota bacterium]
MFKIIGCISAVLLLAVNAWCSENSVPEPLIVMDSSNGTMELQSFFSRLLEKDSAAGDLEVEITVNNSAEPDKLNKKQVIATAGRKLPDKSGVRAEVYAWLPVLIAVPETMPLESISVEDLRRIYSGRISSWSRLKLPGGAVRRAGYPVGSAVERAFRQLVMLDDPAHTTKLDPANEIAPGMVTIRTAAAAGTVLESWNDVIVFGSWQLAEVKKCKLLKINNIAPSRENILSGKYPLAEKHALLYSSSQKPGQLPQIADFLRKSARSSGHFIVP